MNKALISFLLLLCGNSVFAKLPEGVWVSKNLVNDDGGYGSYYRGWYYVSDTSVDALITLGAHYHKQKLKIQQDDGSNVRLWDSKEKTSTEFAYSLNGDILSICNSPTSCREYTRTDERPQADVPPALAPEFSLKAKWCVENDCEEVSYSKEQSAFLCNLNSDFRPYFSRYRAPEALLARYQIQMDVLVYAFRLNNQNELASYSTNMYLQSMSGLPQTIAESGVQLLKTGTFSFLEGTLQKRKITVDFSIIQ